MLDEIIAVAVIVLVVGGAIAYIIKEKKSGKKCIGCPYSSSCSSKSGSSCGGCNGSCTCSDNKTEEK